MRDTIVLVVLVCLVLSQIRATNTTPTAKPQQIPTVISEQIPTPTDRTWKSKSMRTTPTAKPAYIPPPLDASTEPQSNQQTLPVLLSDDQEKEIVVFKGKHHRTRGPCVEVAGGRAMLSCDAFTVTEVVDGNLAVSDVTIIPGIFSCVGFAHSKELKVGTVYTLRFTPSAATKRELREIQNKDRSVSIKGDELAIIETED